MNPEVDALLPELYEELRRQASRLTARHPGSMQPSSVVNEVWLKLSRADSLRFQDKAHFGAVAATAMRQVLTDRARRRGALKRGGGADRVELDVLGVGPRVVEVLAIDEALGQLEQARPRTARVVELRLLGGLTVEESAEALGMSAGTVKREWRLGRAFLIQQLH